MLKLLLILLNLVYLNSQNHILNIEKGDSKVSKYLETIKPFEWKITSTAKT
jgi:hypothetical protein